MYHYSHRVLRIRQRTALAGLVAVFVGFLVVISVCIWGIAIGLGIKDKVEPVSGWPQTAGWVASFRTYQEGDQGPSYRAVIAFREHNKVVTFDAPITTQEPPLVGSRALVSYDPLNPANAHDLSIGSSWEFPFYAGILFLILALFAILLLARFVLRARRRRGGLSFAGSTAGGEGKHVRGSAL
jgi:hypothetical protein